MFIKKTLPLLLALLFLCACVPTPETEYVVYRGDDAVEQKLSATAAPVEAKPAALPFPTSWREAAYDINDRFRVEIDAEIVQKRDGVYPVWRTREESFSDADLVSFAEKLLPFLTEEEAAVYRRGRNAKVNSLPKHASPGEYHAATGLETLFGWLYLRGDKPRINRLFEIITEE